MSKMLPSHFYQVLNSYFYVRKTADFIEWKKKKGTESASELEELDNCIAKQTLLEKELYECCVGVSE